MTLVLLGDSHLERVRRDLHVLGDDVVNLAVGGARVRHLPGQLALLPERTTRVLLSIGTNDAQTGGTPLDALQPWSGRGAPSGSTGSTLDQAP